MTYGLITKFLARPGERDALTDCLLLAAERMPRASGCVHYLISTSDEPEAVWVSEVWVDQAAHDASLKSEDVMALIGRARPLIASVAEQIPLAVLGGKGLPT
ncbi:putative quinol monooxygenase [Streptomyces beihaiensis]|uniref:Antibiotic biosynthesis monooxygenase n=1 Tax=Streptomyces beihaiensis TaxID=2984495 RepID=A0ABT3TWP4_9ACTN|nr:putative quinol monooxygenase [Streptomyces beihaiensis]MCX3061481.1 antibiotic biosynthesis monooxygenase [Streptomyces beihaiensis]